MGDHPFEEEAQQYQLPFDDFFVPAPQSTQPKPKARRKTSAKTLKAPVFGASAFSEKTPGEEAQALEVIPEPILPTRWEGLQDQIGNNMVSLLTIIRPIPEAMKVVDAIIRYIKTTNGCQLFVIRADTGSGKTTFLNTLPHYMKDVHFHVSTLDLEILRTEERFSDVLWSLETPKDGSIYLIILEGREEPYRASDAYIQAILSAINRFSRNRRVPLLFVIPTPEDHVARNWCERAQRLGDLIPEAKYYGGSLWYPFPGVPKEMYVDVVEKTVSALNPPHTLYDFGISPDEPEGLAERSTTIGRLMETIAGRISTRRGSTILSLKGERDHVWIVYVAPDLRHFDHTFFLIDSLCMDEKLHVAPLKIVAPESETSSNKNWRQPEEWLKLVSTLKHLDVRLINVPIVTVVAAALASNNNELLKSFKTTPLEKYQSELLREFPQLAQEEPNWWESPLTERKEQIQNARLSLERTNLYSLLRGSPAKGKSGLPESPLTYAQYLHLRQHASEREMHHYIGDVLHSLLKYNPFPGLKGVEIETRFIPEASDPVPDITIRTDTDNYLLEFHFMQKQISASEIARYALKNVISKYQRSLPYLASLLKEIKTE